ncbi:ABC transporter permease [Neorhizobium galegae]|uniref:Glutathione ABC transporter permease GsiC n=1 Tax=Neorhizobium galegae bv. orientalis str. HAMBI 540 TaxID=1028800 RepID=A0A068T1N6_NEOGA|nr:ABC transporter permease [Neorhizobium galegae]MCQ1854600.1 ABC transporter permease [Neorhizobium galegae]CDN51956.1 Glutathione ABC transporter permease GsiC [Neorhizobium galegae bv. orientalis str. HAMBI 540]CDZ51510.1 Glutathione ABC transporter, permease protein GsiC [Neorhizobium galegae bv. orientalis]
MAQYVLRRLVQSLFVLAGLTIVVFFVTRQIGDVARLMLPIDATEQQYLQMRQVLGLNDPLIAQFGYYVLDLLRGDFGMSLWQNVPAMGLVLSRFPATALLAFATLTFAFAIALPVGIGAALKPGSIFDRLATVISIFGLSVPTFWLALLLITVFSVQLGWLKTSGYGGFEYLILPMLAISAQSIGRLAQVVKTSMLDVLNAQYLVTARSKGLYESVIVIRHGLRNALLPIVTILGDEIIGLLNGSVVIEVIFGWPGIGKLTIDAIERRDFAVIQASVIFVALTVIAVNLIVDLAYAWLDPRIRYS